MKSNQDGIAHKKLPSSTKQLLVSLSVCLRLFTNMQRKNNQKHYSRPTLDSASLGSRMSSYDMPPAYCPVNDPVHVSTANTSYNPPFLMSPSPTNGYGYTRHELSSHLMPHVPPVSSMGSRSVEVVSPPKPYRVASALTFLRQEGDSSHTYPLQAHHQPPQIPRNIIASNMAPFFKAVGDPSLRIYRLQLPPHLIHLLDFIVLGCEGHAATLPNAWFTKLYSLTKCDIALRDIPHLYETAKPITAYIKGCMQEILRVHLTLDENQPHVLKYSMKEGHTGVELHHDKCDYSANMCLSRRSSYIGGGTFFPAASETVFLERGEFLIHPGALLHAGLNVSKGTRHLMIIFANVKK